MRIDRDRASVEAFYVLLGASLVVAVATDVRAGVWEVHTGRLFPWRHIGPFPLWSTRVLSVSWALLGAAGLALAVGKGRNTVDRRQDIARRDADREAAREIARSRKGH